MTGQVALQPALFDDAVADPEPWVSATALVMRGHVRVNYGRQHARAEEDFLAATGIFTALAERWGMAISLAGLAMLEGRPDDARAALRRAVEQGGPPDIAQRPGRHRLGYLSAADGDLETARRWHAQALDTARSSSDAPVIAQALTAIADLALREDDPERAAELLGASVAVRGTTDRSVQDEERVTAGARAALGEARYADAYQRVTMDTLAALTPGA